MSSSIPHASSTFWLIDTTSVSGTFTTTATFTLWVPLYTTSTIYDPPSHLPEHSNTGTSKPPKHTTIIASSVIGSLVVLSLMVGCFWLYRKRRARPFVRRAFSERGTEVSNTPQMGSAHALLDLTAEPEPHPESIEPWVGPAVSQEPAKLLSERQRGYVQTSSIPHGGPSRTELTTDTANLTHTEDIPQHASQPSAVPAPVPTQALQLVTPNPPIAGEHAVFNSKSTGGPSQARRRRNRLEMSPPRLEEDAGVSLMRAGDGSAESTDGSLPPAYDITHAHHS